MIINYNGNFDLKSNFKLSKDNRALKFGDALYETLKVIDGKIIFSEDHYFRLMASMRMLRMKISEKFTLEYFESQILNTLTANKLYSSRIRFTIFRKEGGLYLPENNNIDFIIEAHDLIIPLKHNYVIDLFKDYYQCSDQLSTLKTNNKILNVVASIYADENELDNCILMNENKHIVEAVNSNIFLIKGNQIKTPSLSEGCLKGVIRKNLIMMIQKDSRYEIQETEISPFELLKVDEVFLTNSIVGIQSVTRYRKKIYKTVVAEQIYSSLKKLELLS